MKTKLIFNPASGNPSESALQLMELLRHLQAHDFKVEVLIVQPEHQLQLLSREAVRAGAKMVIVSGGDGTVEAVALGLIGTQTTLGIIPTGTRNNLARSLGIPANDIPNAVALLRAGRRISIDVGRVRHRKTTLPFLEATVIGLGSAMYAAADDIQHGGFGKISEFISTLMAAVPSEIRLRLDHQREEVVARAHMAIVANMPYMGANFQIAPDVPFDDGQLDVFVYSDLGKLDLIGQAMQSPTAAPDARIQRFRAKTITITTTPVMPVIADGVALEVGAGSVTVMMHPHHLRVMAGLASPTPLPTLDTLIPDQPPLISAEIVRAPGLTAPPPIPLTEAPG